MNNINSPQTIDCILCTDGSGYSDGYSGAAALLLSSTGEKIGESISGFNEGTVPRAEFTALLQGLRLIMKHFKPAVGKRINVDWYTDCEWLARSLSIDPVTGKWLYARNMEAQGDLWVTYTYFSTFINVNAIWVGRNSTDNMEYVDARSSNMRQVVKAYYSKVGDKPIKKDIRKSEKLDANIAAWASLPESNIL